MPSLIDRRSSLAYVVEPDDNTLNRATPWEVRPTTLTQTTIISAQFSGAAATDYVSNYIEVVDPDSNVYGEIARITAFVAATDTATLEGFSAVPNSGVSQCRMWISPDPVIVHSAVGGATSVVPLGVADASGRPGRDEASGFWADPDRYHIVGISGVNAGRWALVTAWDGVTFTIAAGTGSAAWAAATVGDLSVIRRAVLPVAGELPRGETPQAHIERRFVRGDFSLDLGVPGPRDGGSMEVAAEIRALSLVSAAATAAQRPSEAGDLLDSIFTETADRRSDVVAGSTTVAVNITDGTLDRFGGAAVTDVGTGVLIQGTVAFITAKAVGAGTEDILTVTPALPQAPAVGVLVNGGVNYRPQATGFRTLTWEAYIGGEIRQLLHGHLPNLRIEGLVGNEIPRLIFGGPTDGHFRRRIVVPWTLQHDTTLPIPARASRVVLGGTAVIATTATFDVGYEVQSRAALTGFALRDGNEVVGRMTKGTLRIWADEGTAAANRIHEFERGAALELLIQCGSDVGNVWALWCPRIQYTSIGMPLEAGQYVYELPFNVALSNITGVSDFTMAWF